MPIVNVVVYSFIAGLSTMTGVLLVKRYSEWTKRNSLYLISFAVGILLANALFHLIPEAAELTSNWMYYTLGGILLLFIVEHFITIHACVEPEECEIHTLGIVSIIGIGLHSLIDGIIIGIGFEISPLLGLLSSIAVIAHEIPEGVFTYTLLKHSNVPENKTLIYSWLVALATPFGALATILLFRNFSPAILGILLSFAAGSFIYIGSSDLTPELHKKSSLWNVILILLGIGFVIFLGQILE